MTKHKRDRLEIAGWAGPGPLAAWDGKPRACIASYETGECIEFLEIGTDERDATPLRFKPDAQPITFDGVMGYPKPPD